VEGLSYTFEDGEVTLKITEDKLSWFSHSISDRSKIAILSKAPAANRPANKVFSYPIFVFFSLLIKRLSEFQRRSVSRYLKQSTETLWMFKTQFVAISLTGNPVVESFSFAFSISLL
jgi:hypothetical protein